jgi:hypothetical protein
MGILILIKRFFMSEQLTNIEEAKNVLPPGCQQELETRGIDIAEVADLVLALSVHASSMLSGPKFRFLLTRWQEKDAAGRKAMIEDLKPAVASQEKDGGPEPTAGNVPATGVDTMPILPPEQQSYVEQVWADAKPLDLSGPGGVTGQPTSEATIRAQALENATPIVVPQAGEPGGPIDTEAYARKALKKAWKGREPTNEGNE